MRIQMTKQMWQAMEAPAEFAEARKHLSNLFNIDESDFNYQRTKEFDIAGKPHGALKVIGDCFAKLAGTRGHQAASRTIRAWTAAKDTTGMKKAKSVEEFAILVTSFFAAQPHQRVYWLSSNGGGDDWRSGRTSSVAEMVASRAYHLSTVEYVKESHTHWGTTPAHVNLHLAYKVFGQMLVAKSTLWPESCKGMTVIDGLRSKNILIETEDLRGAYLEESERWEKLAKSVGFQCLARGQADDDLDGNPARSGWWWTSNIITLDPQGEPSRVVIDVFSEDDKKRPDTQVDLAYWEKKRKDLGVDVITASEERDEDELNADADEYVEEEDTEEGAESEVKMIEIPIYPMLAVFDMKRHLRLRVHVSQLEDYVYDTKLGSRLILPADVRDLVQVLLTQRAMFTDVIAGKGGGIVILCAGPPGTGKTLTAEIYAEVMKRPLYAVQTSQLGTSAQELENELRKVFARAFRWGAILLLDEADVYVRARGDDLDQNAIVGVFLRVLEYYQGILFLTTNRVDMVDDAIASRCIARIDYRIPHPDDQKRIWRVLATTSEVDLSDTEIDLIVEKFNDLSGRDIKNLLKLAKMISQFKRAPVTLDTIAFVKRFKPTGPGGSQYEQQAGGGLEIPQAERRAREIS